MIKSIVEQEVIISEEQKEQNYWDRLNFDSHRWVEVSKGYFKCSFCHTNHTSVMPINGKPFCELNPYIRTTKMKLI